MSNRQTLKSLSRLTVAALEKMSDSQLQAIAAPDPHDLTGLIDAELDAIIHNTANPDLLARVEATRKGT
ncbi:MAG: hypothetical protein PHQ58_21965 [Rhodoferax sp.]|uniref:hypothetical protein n=1 Tax=Rhodoferax sp. TaxID=50421 RepID=UPI00260CA062|nr:hypothetical protein [Rhodoferax sp.]MDD2883088.1 hypothetical protein [Rhodoferax sp.]